MEKRELKDVKGKIERSGKMVQSLNLCSDLVLKQSLGYDVLLLAVDVFATS